ncbi:SphI restriction endonuclease [Candidatus Moduliflexus flocculans]|uniref:SphI restriction endonuclease n=1 Tax=Candidatus Moduliflexus flocculans TaxID=1499966 RepID=A0A081BQF7_9BACT|nr:SphI restriction endonuclease [Candidatus Moduliflexus flocculans]
MSKTYPKAFLERCHAVTAKRPKTVIEHILKHGQITTEELKELYGYNHPPRAIRDVREQGIPLETFRVTGSDGRKIAAYRFGDTNPERFRKLSGRTGLSKKIKAVLVEKYGCQCFIYLEKMDESELQIDHRVPYEVAGDDESIEPNPNDFMLLSGSANRAKSWSCEHCENWQTSKEKNICLSCYWAYPENYAHVAMRQVRRLDMIWQNNEIGQYEQLKHDANLSGQTIPEFVKKLIEKAIERKREIA